MARKGKGLSTFIMLLFVLSAFSPLLISVSLSASDPLPYTEADLGTGINPCSDEAQKSVDKSFEQHQHNVLDRDGDGICNCFEYYGFRYDFINGTYVRAFELNETGKPVRAPQDPKDPYFLTDPTQFSTDQDPYDDGMEASGVNMDTAVLPPGNHPLVPGYPDIYARMNSYEITPVGPITTTTGKTTQKAWSESTTWSDETSTHWGTPVGVSKEADAGFSGKLTKASIFGDIINAFVSFATGDSKQAGGDSKRKRAKAQVKVARASGVTHTTSHSTTTENSGFTQQEWSQAETTDPSQAARIKLNLKFHNLGAAPTKDVIPTASILLGGKTINTFTFDDKIDYLPANSFYPKDSDWSVEKDKDGKYIYLTLDELRAFEAGAKIKLDITQMEAKVKKWEPGTKQWEFTQDWAPYKDSMDHVCACLMVDKGDGNLSDYLVYAASPKPTGPVVTLRDAVLWVVGGENDPKTGVVYINIRKPDGTVIKTPIKDWRFGVDPDTFNQIEPGSYVLNVTMKPGMVVVAKAPPYGDLEYPQIKWVYSDAKAKVIKAYLTDYYEVSNVVFKSTPDADGQNMSTDGSNIYTFNLASDYVPTGEEIVEATNDAGKSAYKHVLWFSPAWSMFRHDSMHTARSPHTGSDTATQKWRFPTGDYVTSSPAIGWGGIIYVGSLTNYVYAINPDGTQKWRFKTGDYVRSSPAIGADGTIYVGSGDHYVYAINPDGTQKWRFKTGDYVHSSPAIGADGTIYVGSNDGGLYAINPDGTQKWRFIAGGWVETSPAIGADGTIYVGSDYRGLYAINPDGTQKWRFKTGSYVSSSPAIGADGTIYVGSLDNYLYAINPDGTQKWRFKTGGNVTYSSPAIGADGTIYVGSLDNYLYAINPDGTQKWRFKTGDDVHSSPAIGANGTIYVGSDDNYVYAINPDGTQKWRSKTGDAITSSLAIGADGTIYVGSDDTYLYAIGK